MRIVRVLRLALGAVAAFLIAVLLGRTVHKRRTARYIDDLRRTATTDRSEVFTTDELENVPEPVRNYFITVLRDGQHHVDSVRLEQEGTLRPGDADSGWKPFTATQYSTVSPPGFFWDASVRLWPLIDIRVVDLYHDGTGRARVSLLGLIPLGGDDASGTLTFHFTEDGEVSKVHAEQRPRRVDDGYEPTPWTGRFDDYETRNGMRIPTAAEVIWHLPDEDVVAWRGRITDVSYDEW